MQQSTRCGHRSKRTTTMAAATAGIAAITTGVVVTLSGPASTATTGSAGIASARVAPSIRVAPPAAALPSAAVLPSAVVPPSAAVLPALATPAGKSAGHPRAPRKTRAPVRARAGRIPRRDVGGRRLASHGIAVAPGAMPLPAIPASAYVVANADTGKVLAAKDPHGLYPPASTLKVLTAITMLPRLNPDATVVATKLAASVEPNIVGLIPGHRYK